MVSSSRKLVALLLRSPLMVKLDKRGFSLNDISSETLSSVISRILIFTSSNNFCFHKLLIAFVMSSPGILIFWPISNPDSTCSTLLS